jgi:hypothetical protein
MNEMEQSGVPPAGEEIHMPQPSVIPIINAAALSIAIVGVTLSWVLSVAGVIVFLATAASWIAHTRRDIAELPLEHRH